MTHAISKLLKTYEDGKMSRRQLVQGLALLAGAAEAASAAGFEGNTVNHISIYVSNLQRSTDYYQKTFGCKVNKRQGNNQLMFGRSFLVLREDKPPGKVDHFAVGVDNFNKDSVTADLKARGATPVDSQGGFGFHVVDPDGFPIQITGSNNAL